MRIVEAFLSRHRVLAYFGLTFTISWGGVLLVIGGPAGMTGVKAQDNSLFPLAVLATLAGPSVTGILLTGLIDGKRGLRELRTRLLDWRVDGRWYAIALLAAPLVATAVTLLLSFVSPEFLPGLIVADDKLALLLLGLAVGVAAGSFEELGWTGFAIPQLRRRYGVLATGLTVGLLWSAWHLLVVVWGMGDRNGSVPVAVFVIVDGLAGLPAFRVLMVWVYDRTESLFLAVLMHLSLTATVLILTPQVTGVRLLTYWLAFAAVVWVVIALAMSSGVPKLRTSSAAAGATIRTCWSPRCWQERAVRRDRDGWPGTRRPHSTSRASGSRPRTHQRSSSHAAR